jgi:LysR family hydrogen peroxide-inducible transcriptional activator
VNPPKCVHAGRRRIRPEFHQLEVFIRVVESGSFSAAARQMECTQSAVSQTIARLEQVYGGELFERRSGPPLRLTSIGEAILPSAKMLLRTVDAHLARTVTAALGRMGSLAIGFHPGLVSGPFRLAIQDFATGNPGVRLRFVEAPAPELHRHLNDRTVDVAITMSHRYPADPKFARELLWEDRLMLVLREDHSLAERETIATYDLASLSLIVSPELGPLPALRTLLDRHRDINVHDVSISMIFDLVVMGFGQAIALGSTMADRPDLVARPIANEGAVVPIEGIWPADECDALRDRLLVHVRDRDRHQIHR